MMMMMMIIYWLAERRNNSFFSFSFQKIIMFFLGLEVDKSQANPTLRSRVFTFDIENFKWESHGALDEPRCMMGLGELNGNLVVTGKIQQLITLLRQKIFFSCFSIGL